MSYRMKKMAAVFCCMILAVSMEACGNSDNTNSSGSNAKGADTAVETTISAEEQLSSFSFEDMFTERDLEGTYEESNAVSIILSDGATSCDSGDVNIDNDTITISKEGVYVLSGTLSNGQIVVDAEESKVQLILSGVSVSNASTAAVYVKNADKVFLTLAEGTSNTLSVTDEFAAIDENNIDAVVFSKDDLCLNGTGELTVSCASGHGVVSKDDLKVTGGTYIITATGHALSGKNSVRIANGSFTLRTGTSTIHSENEEEEEKGYIYIADGTFTIASEGKGINATAGVYLLNGTYEMETEDDSIHSDADCIVEAGNYTLTSGDDGIHAGENLMIEGGTITVSDSYEGLEGMTITINDGKICVTSSDDGLNAAGGTDGSGFGGRGSFGGKQGGDVFGGTGSTGSYWIKINGGSIWVNAGGDGMDSNGTAEFNGGTVYVSGPTDNGNSALDSEMGMTVNGGTIVAAGSSGMAENFSSDSTQGAILLTYESSMNGTITLSDENGNELVICTPEKSYNCVQISCDGIAVGKTYTVTSGINAQTIEMTELIYGNSGMMGNRGQGGFGGLKGDSKDWNKSDMKQNGERPNREQGNGKMPAELPEGTELPEGMEPPEGMELPEEMAPPEA